MLPSGSQFIVPLEYSSVPPIVKVLITSRRFWAGVSAIAVPILNKQFNWGLSEEAMTTMAIAVVGWIVGESLRSSENPSATKS